MDHAVGARGGAGGSAGDQRHNYRSVPWLRGTAARTSYSYRRPSTDGRGLRAGQIGTTLGPRAAAGGG